MRGQGKAKAAGLCAMLPLLAGCSVPTDGLAGIQFGEGGAMTALLAPCEGKEVRGSMSGTALYLESVLDESGDPTRLHRYELELDVDGSPAKLPLDFDLAPGEIYTWRAWGGYSGFFGGPFNLPEITLTSEIVSEIEPGMVLTPLLPPDDRVSAERFAELATITCQESIY